MSREYKHYGIRAANRSFRCFPYEFVSSVVAILGPSAGGRYYCYIAFSESFATAVGKKLPRGVSPKDTAYIFVECDKKEYKVFACYADESARALMWAGPMASKPPWLKFIPVKAENDNYP